MRASAGCRESAQPRRGVRSPSTSTLGSSSTAPTAPPVTDASATSARRGRESPTSSPSFSRARRPGTEPASTASERSSGARVRRHRATTSSSPAESPRHSPPSGPALPTRRPRGWPALGPGASASTRRPAKVRESAHGQLVADWVELFAPVVFALHRPAAWPAEGSLLLDHLPFRIRAEDPSGVGIPGGRVAFDVFCAVGYRAGKPRLWHTEAFASAHPDNWSAFFASLPGEPRRAHRGMIQALERRRPAAELHHCEWHLQHALERLPAKRRGGH